MPYVRKFKKNGYRRPGYKACGKMVYGDAGKALAVAKGLRRLLNVEIKNFDIKQTTVAISQTPVIVQLSNIPAGSGTNTRDGSQCKMIGLNLSYTLTFNAASAVHLIRIMLIIDRQTNQAVYAASDLLADVTANDNLITPRNLDNKHRFVILYDRLHMLSESFPIVTVRKYFKRDVLLRFDNSTPSIADLTQNSLSLLQIGNNTTNLPNITSTSRLRYVDN